MAITSLRPVKAKNKRVVINGQVYERTSKTGYTRVESRGIFGSGHEYTDEERARIEAYSEGEADRLLAHYKQVHAGVKERMRKRQEAAMRKVLAMR